MAVTIKDVAKRAGVSLSTVSLVLNNKQNVSEETRLKVNQAIEDLKFHPRRHARGLASKRSGNIGFILTDDHFSRAEPFYTKIFLGTEFEARKFDYYILLTTVSKTFKSGGPVPRFLLEANVDGVIFAGKVALGLVEHVQKLGIPCVLVDYAFKNDGLSCILIDNVQGIRQAITHLIKKGHRKIAFIGGEINHPSINDRLLGYKEALKENHIYVDEALISTDELYTGRNDGFRATERLLERGVEFTALLASNDTMAIGAIQCLRQNGLDVPAQVAVVGFDDIEAGLHVEPHLTTVRVEKEELGAVALRRLMEMIETGRVIYGRTLIPVRLILRGSTND